MQGLRYGNGWAIGAWFVPILSLVRPKQMANEIWRGSERGVDLAGGEAGRGAEPRPLVVGPLPRPGASSTAASSRSSRATTSSRPPSSATASRRSRPGRGSKSSPSSSRSPPWCWRSCSSPMSPNASTESASSEAAPHRRPRAQPRHRLLPPDLRPAVPDLAGGLGGRRLLRRLRQLGGDAVRRGARRRRCTTSSPASSASRPTPTPI